MDAGYLSQQVNTIIGQLHGLFDEIGVPSHDRESREAELFAALSEALNNQVRLVTQEKKHIISEAQDMIITIRQMEASLEDPNPRGSSQGYDDGLEISYPLNRCLQALKEKHTKVRRAHKERFAQVKKLAEALESYSSHLEPNFVRLALPPTGPNQSIPPTFDLSPSYVDKLDNEFTRVYEEYTRRISTVQSLSENIIQLWAELGTPQAQTDGAIVKYYRDAPEQLGLHEEDIARLRARLEKLDSEKKSREKRLRGLKEAVEALWEKLGVDEAERKPFLNANRGCGIRQISEFDNELARLNELKRQNLHLFVEDARCKLQVLWDALYMSEDEMLEFAPAFSDVYSDALLEAHESEITRLEALKEQRAPMLALMEKHRTLISERDELATASQDASRLMMKPQKGEKRDPGKLLREEKMRKRIAKELPKVTADLRKALEQWEDEWGRPFYVHGERYLDNLEGDGSNRATPGPRSRTPANTSMPSKSNSVTKSASPVSRSNSAVSNTRSQAPSRAGAKTPPEKFNSLPTKWSKPLGAQTSINTKGSPTRIPARVPLSNLRNANYSPDKQRQEIEKPNLARRGTVPVMRAPPPKMRDLVAVPETETEAPSDYYSSSDRGSGSGSGLIRQIEPEDVYDDQPKQHSGEYVRPISHHDFRDFPGRASLRNHDDSPRYERFAQSYSQAPGPAIRQISNQSTGSNGTVVTGSENWETYDDTSEPEEDISIGHYAKVRSGRTNYSMEPPSKFNAPQQAKRPRGIPPALHQPHALSDGNGRRVYSGSSGWTDEDIF